MPVDPSVEVRVFARMLGFAFVAGCFSEPTDPARDDGSMAATTGSATCPVGTAGCACDGLQCDVGLVCHAPSHVCIANDCEPGTLDCPCADGFCLAGLACVDERCTSEPPGTESTTSGSSDPTDGSATTSTGDPTLTTEATSATFPQDTSASDSGDTSTTGVDGQCVACMIATLPCSCGDCGGVDDCVFLGNDLATCCANALAGEAEAWDAFVACAVSKGGCADACTDPPECGA